MYLTRKEIHKELEAIYQERRKWSGTKVLSDSEKIRRQLIFIKQEILYQIESCYPAKRNSLKKEDVFFFLILSKIESYLKKLTPMKDKWLLFTPNLLFRQKKVVTETNLKRGRMTIEEKKEGEKTIEV